MEIQELEVSQSTESTAKCSKSLNGSTRRCYDEAFPSSESSSSPEPTSCLESVVKNVEGVSSTTRTEREHKDEELICQAHPSCLKRFSNWKEYEVHYKQRHLHKCATCKRSLPSGHILELHVLEAHDTLFSLMAERKPMIGCFLEACPQLFWKSEERKAHCLTEHSFPESFTLWDLTANSKSGKQQSKSKNKNKGKDGKFKSPSTKNDAAKSNDGQPLSSNSNVIEEPNCISDGVEGMCVTDLSLSEVVKVLQSLLKAKEWMWMKKNKSRNQEIKVARKIPLLIRNLFRLLLLISCSDILLPKLSSLNLHLACQSRLIYRLEAETNLRITRI